MAVKTVTVTSETCVRCGGATGAEVIPGDTVRLWLDQEANSDFPEWVEAVIVTVEPQTASSTAPKEYKVEYETDDLDGAADLLRDCDILSVTCEGCCALINEYLDLLAGVNIPQVSLSYSWNTNGTLNLQAHAVSSQIAGNPGEQVTIESYVFTDPADSVIAESGDPDSRLYSPASTWVGGKFSLLVTDSEGLTNSAEVWVDPYFTGLVTYPAVAPTIASATTVAPTTPVAFVSGVVQIDTITVPSSFVGRGGQLTFIPTGVFTTGTGGNIAIASTAVVGKALTFFYDSGTAKFYPSY